jgi:hypothetical protein
MVTDAASQVCACGVRAGGMEPEVCHVCGEPFTRSMSRWGAAVRAVGQHSSPRRPWRWVLVCGECYWERAPNGGGLGTRRRLPDEWMRE